MIYFSIKELNSIIDIYKLSKAEIINFNNFKKLDLIEVEPDYRIPRGQKAYFIFEAKNLKIAQKQRKYTGTTKSNIHLPFMKLSLQNREFYDINSYTSWGICKITITNKLIRIISQSDKPAKREINLIDIEEVKLVDNYKTVYLSSRKKLWPIKIKFYSKDDANKFQNAIWSSFYSFSKIKRNNCNDFKNSD